MERRGTETNERIAVGSGERRGGRQGSEEGQHEVVEARGRGVLSFSFFLFLSLSIFLSLFLLVVAKGVGKGVHGRWVVIFVPASSLISPHLLRAAALTPRRASPRRTMPRRAATPGRGAVALVGVRLS